MDNHFLLFKVENQIFAFTIEEVVKVSPMVQVVPVPSISAPLMGAVHYMGQAVPLIDLRNLINAPQKLFHWSNHIIVVQGDPCLLAVLCDHVIGLAQNTAIEHENLKPLLKDNPLVRGGFFRENRFVIILNTRELLNKELKSKIKEIMDRIHEQISMAP